MLGFIMPRAQAMMSEMLAIYGGVLGRKTPALLGEKKRIRQRLIVISDSKLHI